MFPFVKQEKDGCGAASIAMVMQYWQAQQGQALSRDSDATQIQRALYSAKAHGIYASDMERYFREKGFRTFTIRGEWEDLQQHLDKGRPLDRGPEACRRRASALRGRDRSWEQGIVMFNDPGAAQTAANRTGRASNGNGARPENGRCWRCLKPNLADPSLCFSFFCRLPPKRSRKPSDPPCSNASGQLTRRTALAGN